MLSNTLPIPPTDTRKLRQLLFTGKRRQGEIFNWNLTMKLDLDRSPVGNTLLLYLLCGQG